MSGLKLVHDNSDISTRFHDIASSLAIAAAALSQAAQAMSAAARVMAEASRDFGLSSAPVPEVVDEPMGEHHERDLEDNVAEATSDDRASEVSTEGFIAYNNDDFAVFKDVYSDPAAPHDLSETHRMTQPGTSSAPAATAGPSLLGNDKIGITCFPTSKQLNRDFARPGLYFVVIEEAVDAIPFISYVGLKNQKTVCYVPSPESLGSYRKLFQDTMDLSVIYPTSIAVAGDLQDVLASTTRQTILLQSYSALHAAPLPNSMADALVCWGYPTNFESYIDGGANCVTQSYLLLSPEEYSKSLVQSSLARFNITWHPTIGRINDRNVSGLLYQARHKVMEHIEKDAFSGTATYLYYTFIAYLSAGCGQPEEMTPEEISRAANTYAAKVLLRGRKEDGSKWYPPIADRPTLTSGAIKTFNLISAQEAGLLN